MSTSKPLPSHSGPPPTKSTIPPSPTLYVTNLPEKLRKADLRTALYMLFSTYGVVLDVVAMRGAKMRGQAHIVMRDVNASMQAMRQLQGFDFFEKEMKIVYSDNKSGRSHVFNRLEGQWKEAASSAGEVAAGDKKASAFEAPRPGANGAMEVDKAGPGLSSAPSVAAGTKRPREDEEEGDEEQEEEVAMDEESDDDVDMEQSDED